MLDILNNDAFSVTTLSAAVTNEQYKPGFLGERGLFDVDGITSTTATIEVENGKLSLVAVKPRGAAGTPLESTDRFTESFVVPHLPQDDVILADSIQNVRAFGAEDQLQTVQRQVVKRLAAMARNNEYTLESHRMAAIQGKYFDANGNQNSAYDKFGITEKSVAMALTNADTEIQDKAIKVLDAIDEALGGLGFDGVEVLCGKTFWSNLITNNTVKDAYKATADAGRLRENGRLSFEFGGITWIYYHGTTDVKIPDTEARAYPTGVMDFLITRYAPANYSETVNTEGLPYYAKLAPMDFDTGFKAQVQSNPLNICTRPGALIKLKNAAS